MNDEVIEMGLCEVSHIFLRPNVLYRFVILPNCKECARLGSAYDNTENVKESVDNQGEE